jgi:DNA-binding transcriptional regulator GbsR (MarR family)
MREITNNKLLIKKIQENIKENQKLLTSKEDQNVKELRSFL